VAVADFDYVDTSGETLDQGGVHTARLAEFAERLRQGFAADPRFADVALACAASPCSARSLPAGMLEQAAAGAHARLLVFGGLHKMSTLVQWIQVEVLDLETHRILLSRTLSFRGDTDKAWRRAAEYVSGMALAVEPD
jgi:hypothetical protein